MLYLLLIVFNVTLLRCNLNTIKFTILRIEFSDLQSCVNHQYSSIFEGSHHPKKIPDVHYSHFPLSPSASGNHWQTLIFCTFAFTDHCFKRNKMPHHNVELTPLPPAMSFPSLLSSSEVCRGWSLPLLIHDFMLNIIFLCLCLDMEI